MSSSPAHHEQIFRSIINKDTHDQLVKRCTNNNIPTILHVYNSAVPRCQAFLTKLESWATSSSYPDQKIQYAKMDYTSKTSFMFKFAPNQLPITVLMVGPGWARTVTGAELEQIEGLVGDMMIEHDKLTG